MPEHVLVRGRATGQKRLARAISHQAPIDAPAALVSPALLKELEPDFDPAVQFTASALVRPARFLDAVLYAPRDFASRLWTLIALLLASLLAALGVLVSATTVTSVLWVWFGGSLALAMLTFALGIREALKP